MKTIKFRNGLDKRCRPLSRATMESLFKKLLKGKKGDKILEIIPVEIGDTIECYGFLMGNHKIFYSEYDKCMYLVFRPITINRKKRGRELYSYYRVSYHKFQPGHICLYRCTEKTDIVSWYGAISVIRNTK